MDGEVGGWGVGVTQDNISWAIGFGVPACAMVLAIVLFVAGSKRYTHVEPTERYSCSSFATLYHPCKTCTLKAPAIGHASC